MSGTAATAPSATVIDGSSLPWVNGQHVYDTMEPAFRDNLGDPARVMDLFSRYWMRSLWLDPTTSRRIDHVRADPGYVDLCEAYHDSVEEALFLAGEVDLSAEGHFVAGDYFWRPPGWVHMADSPLGFENLLMMEGKSAAEGSDRVSRVVRPDDEAGLNARPESRPGIRDDLGPRGYVRKAEARFMIWREHDDATTGLVEDGQEPLESKLLSLNEHTGGRSVLVRLPAGWSATPRPVDRERFLISTGGALRVGDRTVGDCSLVHVPAGAVCPTLEAEETIELLVKVGEQV